MFYRINDSIGVLKDEKAFYGKIAEHMKYEKKVEVTPLAETREALFEKIVEKTFDIEALVSAIRDMANLHQQRTPMDYSCNPYLWLCGMMENASREIKTLANATDPEFADEELRPLCESEKEKRTSTV